MKIIFRDIITLFVFLIFLSSNISRAQLLWENDLKDRFINNEAIIYEINIRTFNAEDKNGNGIIEFEKGETSGNFINAIERLDELKKLGINTIHVMPISKIGKQKAFGTAGSLYSLDSFDQLNEQLDCKTNRLNVKEEMALFVSKCHEKNIRVIVDLPSCGSYDLALKKPNLFIHDENHESIVPGDWSDVRIFKTLDEDDHKSYNKKLFEEHKKFIDMLLDLKVDGLRADVATIKPFFFWKDLISYTKEKDPQFLYLAEASSCWTEPISKFLPFVQYDRLLSAGFDGYYGNYFEFKNISSPKEFKNLIMHNLNTIKKFKCKKSTIGSFSTHDELSPLLIGKTPSYSVLLAWLNATLPLNPYFPDGFTTGDTYSYNFANKIAAKSFTDDKTYFLHQGKLDIFNFSRKPYGTYPFIGRELKNALEFRRQNLDIITKGDFKILKTSNDKVVAFQRCLGKKRVIVVFNLDREHRQIAKINAKLNSQEPQVIRNASFVDFVNKDIEVNLLKNELQVYLIKK